MNRTVIYGYFLAMSKKVIIYDRINVVQRRVILRMKDIWSGISTLLGQRNTFLFTHDDPI